MILPQHISFDNSQMTKYARGRLYNSPMETVYIDSMFVINFLTDYLLCLASARICGLRLRRLRYAVAGLFGGLYSVAVFLPGLSFLSLPAAKLGAGIITGYIAFFPERRPLGCIGVFLAVSAAFGGALWALGLSGGFGGVYNRLSMKLLLMCFTGCYGLGLLIFRCRAVVMNKKLLAVELEFSGEKSAFTALMDTGNNLRDPITGAEVMLVCSHALKPIFKDSSFLFSQLEPVELLELSHSLPQLKGRLRLIPYSSIGGSGLLPVFRPDKLLVDGRVSSGVLVAVSDSAAGEGFEAIL